MSPEEIAQNLTDRGVALESTLVRDEFDGRDGSAFWAITIIRNGQSFQTEYSAGAMYRFYPNKRGAARKMQWAHLAGCNGSKGYDRYLRNKASKPTKPQLADVMACLVSDAQCVAYGQTFEDFASELGFDEDSRKGEKAYNACRDCYFAMIRLFGQDGFEELQELFQDY